MILATPKFLRSRQYRVGMAALGFALAAASRASADTQTFAFVIDNGLALTSRSDANGQTVSVASGKLRTVDHGRKIFDKLGLGRVTFWNRTIPDPFFAALGTQAALIVFEFAPPMNVRAHLTMIQTPLGTQTGIGAFALNDNGKVISPAPFVRGRWTMASGATISGGSPSDLVIHVVVEVVGSGGPTELPATFLDLTSHMPSPPFSSDPGPTSTHLLDPSTAIGSFYGQTLLGGQITPVRSYSSYLFPALWAHLLAVPTGPADYLIVACWDFVSTTTPKHCSVSGTGPSLAPLAGWATYSLGATSTRLTLRRFLVP